MRSRTIRRGAGAVAGLAVAMAAGQASAGAWPAAPGRTLVIAKYEAARADRGLDDQGDEWAINARKDEAVSVYVEHGLTSRLTFQGKASVVSGRDGDLDYRGRGPVELGLRYAVVDRPGAAVSLYAGGVLDGDGRNAGYAAPGTGGGDLELRILAGRSGVIDGRAVFAEAQAARLKRSDLPDETRFDTTFGLETGPWLWLAQTYAGRADGGDAAPTWLKAELSAVRRLGAWRIQAGWRRTLAGQVGPLENGPVLGVWRNW